MARSCRGRLDGYGVIGTLSLSIGKVQNLVSLNLACNSELVGPIPEEIGNLSQLSALDLTDFSFSGSIPASLGNLRNASYIYLKRNQLTGEIPYTLGYLSQAFEFSLGRTNLTGTTPASSPNGFPVGLNDLTSLMIFDLSANAVGGPLPEFHLKLPLINKLNLNLNQFTGVRDGTVRASGHVNVFLINNNISSVANLSNPFI